MNKIKFEEVVKNKGLKKNFISDKLGISERAFQYKINGVTSFKPDEILIMRDLLMISNEQAWEIFLENR